MEYSNEFEQSANEYLQLPPFNYYYGDGTINPTLLQRTDSQGLPSSDYWGNYRAPTEPAPLPASALDAFFEEQGQLSLESQGLPNLPPGVNPGGLAQCVFFFVLANL